MLEARIRAFETRYELTRRESLYKALTPGAKPRFDTILKVARALGLRLSARVA